MLDVICTFVVRICKSRFPHDMLHVGNAISRKCCFVVGLSKWVRPKVQTFENFSQTLDSLSVFTEQMIKEMPVVE